MSERDFYVDSDACITPDGLYRYALRRSWDPAVWPLAFIMLNPSTADTEIDDPTIRRCMGFARRLGYGGITVYNLYAYRATKPADLWKVEDPVGPGNDHWLNACLYSRYMADLPVVAAWGANARPDRVDAVMRMRGAENLCCFGVTKAGAPRHPLYLPGDAELVPWAGARIRPSRPNRWRASILARSVGTSTAPTTSSTSAGCVLGGLG